MAEWKWRRKPDGVEFLTPPADRVPVDVQRRIGELDVLIFIAAQVGDWPRVDRLLDMRNAIRPPKPLEPEWPLPLRPSVPVTPGWTS